jgi:hypothetical protein
VGFSVLVFFSFDIENGRPMVCVDGEPPKAASDTLSQRVFATWHAWAGCFYLFFRRRGFASAHWSWRQRWPDGGLFLDMHGQ